MKKYEKIEIGQKYKYIGGESHWHEDALEPLGVGINVGDVIEVLGICDGFISDINGVSKFKLKGDTYSIEDDHPNVWGLFSSDMVGGENKYGIELIEEKVKFGSGGIVGVSSCEADVQKDIVKSYLGLLNIKTLEQQYDDWVVENLHIYELFCKFTMQAIDAGKKKISHWLIVNRIRWEVEIETKAVNPDDLKYKISNDYIAFLARDFIKDHPEHSGIFNLKVMKRV